MYTLRRVVPTSVAALPLTIILSHDRAFEGV